MEGIIAIKTPISFNAKSVTTPFTEANVEVSRLIYLLQINFWRPFYLNYYLMR